MSKKPIEITMNVIPSSKRGQLVQLVRFVTRNSNTPFILKIVSKSSRRKIESNFNSRASNLQTELFFLIQEVSVRTQYFHPGLCQLVAVRNEENYTFLCMDVLPIYFNS